MAFPLWEAVLRAGVSHAALVTALPAGEGSPRNELITRAHAYLNFGRANLSLFELMFGSEMGKCNDASLAEAASAGLSVIF